MPAFTQASCTCPVHCPPEASERRQQRLADERRRGLLTIDCNGGFRPQSARSQPEGSIGTSLSKEVALEFALAYNETAHSLRRSKWAVVTTGGALLLLPIDPEHRPPAPWMFHPAARELTDSDNETAQDLAEAENVARFEHAQIPRVWTVPLVSLMPTWTKREERREVRELPMTGLRQGRYLVIHGYRVIARSDSLAFVGGFSGGLGDDCELAEILEPATIEAGPCADQHEAE